MNGLRPSEEMDSPQEMDARQGVPFDPALISARHPFIIEASAGTGKTYALEQIFLRFVSEGIDVSEIVVVTFTDAATREMKERLRERLQSSLNQSRQSPTAERELEREAYLTRALLRFDTAQISTIHGFCLRLLSEFALESGLGFHTALEEKSSLFLRAVRSALRKSLADGSPFARTLAAWIDRLGEDITDRLADLEKHLARPSSAAPIEMPVRFDEQELSSIFAAVSIEAPNLLRLSRELQKVLQGSDKFGLSFGLDDRLAQLVPETASRSVDIVCSTWIQNLPLSAASVDAWVRFLRDNNGEAARIFSFLLERVLLPESFLASVFLPRVREELLRIKQSEEKLDFDDLIVRAHALATEPRYAELQSRIRSRYRVALIDEFQDTDAYQWDLFRSLFLQSKTEDGRPPPSLPRCLGVIGDPKQAIYRFRGADLEVYEQALHQILEQDGQLFYLSSNYRSSANLVAAVGTIVSGDFFSGSNRHAPPLIAARTDLVLRKQDGEAFAPIHLFRLGSRVVETDENKARTSLYSAQSILRNRIAIEIRTLMDGNVTTQTRDGLEKQINHSDIFILVSNNRAGNEILETLRAAEIPAVRYKEEGIFQSDAAKDLHSVLEALLEPNNETKKLRAFLTPFFSPPFFEQTFGSLVALRALPSDHPFLLHIQQFSTLFHERSYARMFSDLLGASGFSRRELLFRDTTRYRQSVTQIAEILLEHGQRENLAPDELVDHLRRRIAGLLRDKHDVFQNAQASSAAVQILTVHKAKGLEAEIVFLYTGEGPARTRIGVNAFSKPSQASHSHAGQTPQKVVHFGVPNAEEDERLWQADREEIERLIYVALTRAKTRMYLPVFGALPSESGSTLQAVNGQASDAQSLDGSRGNSNLDRSSAEHRKRMQKRVGFQHRLEERLCSLWSKESSRAEGALVLEDVELLEGVWKRKLFGKKLKKNARRPSTETSPSQQWLSQSLPTFAHWEQELSLERSHLSALFRERRGAHFTSYSRMKLERQRLGVSSEPSSSAMAESAAAVLIQELPEVPGLFDEDTSEEPTPSILGYPTTPSWSPDESGSSLQNTASQQDTPQDRDEVIDSPSRFVDAARFGVFVHSLLEQVDWDLLSQPRPSNALDSEAWPWALPSNESVDPKVLRLRHAHQEAMSVIGRFGFSRAVNEEGLRLASSMLNVPWDFPNLHLPDGPRSLKRKSLEVPFAHSLSPSISLLHTQPISNRRERESNFIRGVIDLLFEHEGRIFVGDWKTDRIADTSSESLFEHTQREYSVQQKLYVLAIVRIFDLWQRERYEDRFGGAVYVYLRAAASPVGESPVGESPVGESRDHSEASPNQNKVNRGSVFSRPSWEEMTAWNQELLHSSIPFGYPL